MRSAQRGARAPYRAVFAVELGRLLQLRDHAFKVFLLLPYLTQVNVHLRVLTVELNRRSARLTRERGWDRKVE